MAQMVFAKVFGQKLVLERYMLAMNTKYIPLLLLCVSAITVTAEQQQEYMLVWSDEFDENGPPNPENWTFERGFVRNEELQWYQPDNATCTNGLLVIEARRERVENPHYDPAAQNWKKSRKFAQYTSSCLKTRGLHSWTYGRFEIRAKIDVRPGLWPAFWTLGVDGQWPSNGEIDIMEYYNGKLLANVAHATKQPFKPNWDSVKIPLSDLPDGWAAGYHIWRMDWDETAIRIYLDNELINETLLSDTHNPQGTDIENPFHQPHYMLLNLAIGGNSGGDPSQTEFPALYEIDYVRVYRKKARTDSTETSFSSRRE